MSAAEIIPHGHEGFQLLADTIMPGATEAELKFFGEVVNRTGYDPFRREIWAVKRKVKDGNNWVERWTFQVGIDGYRRKAAETGLYAGCDVDTFPEDSKTPKTATATVWRLVGGQRVPFVAKARWEEYCQRNRDGAAMGLWVTMPHGQLGKCAEALALRRAFPEMLGGTYVESEMEQADNPPIKRVNAEPPALPETSPWERAKTAHAPNPREELHNRVMDAMQADDITDAQLDLELAAKYKDSKTVTFKTWRGLPDLHLAALLAPDKWLVIVANINADPLA